MAVKTGRGLPWPYDCIIGGTGMMLSQGPRKEPPWTENKVRYFDPQSVMTAEERNYQQFPPEIDLPFAQESWKGGYGAASQKRGERDKYSYGLYADCSSGYPLCGPQVNSQQTLTGSPYQIKVFNISGVDTVILACGTRIYKRTDDTATGFTLVSDLGQTIGQMEVFRGTNATDTLYIPLGESTNYAYMSNAGVIASHASQKANGFVVAGDELYLYYLASDNRWVIKKSFDGGAAPTWIGNYTVGDSTSRITDGHIVAGRLILGKTNGLYGVSALVSPLAEDITPSLHESRGSTSNCKNAIVFDENYIFPYDGGLLRYDPETGELAQFGPETLIDNQSEVRGTVQAVVGQDGIGIYSFLYNSSTAKSYMVKWGTWGVEESEGVKHRAPFPAWHGSLYQWNKQVVMAQLVTIDWGTGAGRIPRVYIGCSDGSIYWFYASRTASPLDDPNYRFNTVNTAEVYQSRFTANFPFEFKVFKSAGLIGIGQTGTKQLGAAYKLPTDVTWTSLGVITSEPGEKLTPTGTPADKALDFKITLSTASNLSSPRLTAFVIFSAIRFENLKQITAWINVSDDLTDRSGKIIRQKWQDVRARLETVTNAAGSVTVIGPAGETLTCIALDFGHAMLVEDTAKREYKWISKITLVQTKVEATRGTWDRASAYTWNDLSAFHWSDLQVL